MQVANFAAPDIAEELELLVDSGAIYSVVPGEILARLGVEPRREREFGLANATRSVRRCGVALFRYGDRDAVAEVIFGEPGDAVLLGAFTLEALGLCLDPLKRELLPLPMILAAWGDAHAPVASLSARRAVRVTTTVTATVASKPRTTTA
jgi:predicted aspartyl protease